MSSCRYSIGLQSFKLRWSKVCKGFITSKRQHANSGCLPGSSESQLRDMRRRCALQMCAAAATAGDRRALLLLQRTQEGCKQAEEEAAAAMQQNCRCVVHELNTALICRPPQHACGNVRLEGPACTRPDNDERETHTRNSSQTPHST